jgi:hypothetical protein
MINLNLIIVIYFNLQYYLSNQYLFLSIHVDIYKEILGHFC